MSSASDLAEAKMVLCPRGPHHFMVGTLRSPGVELCKGDGLCVERGTADWRQEMQVRRLTEGSGDARG